MTNEQKRIYELESTLKNISMYLFNIERDCLESDKVMCGTGQIRTMIAKVYPRNKWDEEDQIIYKNLENGKHYFQLKSR